MYDVPVRRCQRNRKNACVQIEKSQISLRRNLALMKFLVAFFTVTYALTCATFGDER